MEISLINVGIGDLKVGFKGDLIRTVLGSCVGICLYDECNVVGGLSHILLPNSKGDMSMPQKYADTAIPLLIKTMIECGADSNNLTAKLIGGAQMFAFANSPIISEIGINNIKKVKEILDNLNIDILAEDLGGDFGRTVDFFVHSGTIIVKSINRPDKVL